jgi:hypothetical protein
VAIFNRSIVDAYKIVTYFADDQPKNIVLTPGRLVLEVKDPDKYQYNSAKGNLDVWERENQLCYEMFTVTPITEKKMAQMVIKDLDSKLGLHGRWERRKARCLVIIKTSDKTVTDTVPAGQWGETISDIVFFNLDYTGKYPPAIDETNFKGKIKLGPYDGSLEGLRKELQSNGFDIIETDREIEVMVITEVHVL